MQVKWLVVLLCMLPFLAIISMVVVGDENNDELSGETIMFKLDFTLVVAPESQLIGDDIPLYLVVRNDSDRIVKADLPDAELFSAIVKDSESNVLPSSIIPSKPYKDRGGIIHVPSGCSVALRIATVRIDHFKIEAKHIKTVTMVIQYAEKTNADYTSLNDVVLSTSLKEYPLQITVSPTKHVWNLGEVPHFRIRITNEGKYPVLLLNYFIDTGSFIVINDKNEKGIHPDIREYSQTLDDLRLAFISPVRETGMLALQPGEFIETTTQVGTGFNRVGKYRVRMQYARSILIMPQNADSYHTEQSAWTSGPVEIAIEEGSDDSK